MHCSSNLPTVSEMFTAPESYITACYVLLRQKFAKSVLPLWLLYDFVSQQKLLVLFSVVFKQIWRNPSPIQLVNLKVNGFVRSSQLFRYGLHVHSISVTTYANSFGKRFRNGNIENLRRQH